MAGLAGFEPAPHVLLVGIVEPLSRFLSRLRKDIERVLRGNSGLYSNEV